VVPFFGRTFARFSCAQDVSLTFFVREGELPAVFFSLFFSVKQRATRTSVPLFWASPLYVVTESLFFLTLPPCTPTVSRTCPLPERHAYCCRFSWYRAPRERMTYLRPLIPRLVTSPMRRPFPFFLDFGSQDPGVVFPYLISS